MYIRDYEVSDFERIKELNKAGFEVPAPDAFLLTSIEAGHAWVAVENETVVAFIIGRNKFDVPYINNLVVDKAHQKKGIATSLIKKFEDTFGKNQKSYNKIYWLQVEIDNPAQKLYFDMGYRVNAVDESYYGPGKHALCMYKGTRPFLHR